MPRPVTIFRPWRHPSSRPVDLRLTASDDFAAAADLDGAGLRDDALHVSIVGARQRTLLAFLSSGCLTCLGFWEAFADTPGLDLPDDIRVVIVTKDAAQESISVLRKLAPPNVAVVMSSAAWSDYRVPGSPYFVLVDGPEGRVRGEGTGANWDQVKNLLRQASDDSTDAWGFVQSDEGALHSSAVACEPARRGDALGKSLA